MTDAREHPAGHWRHTLVLALAAAALTVAAGMVLFSAFMYYDDEGYVLMSLKSFVEHGRLYRDVYTQYGPFPFVFYATLHELGLPLTHLGGRLVTLAAWAGCAGACAALVRQQIRGATASLAVLAATFAYLWIMASEPSHPGSLVALLTAVAAMLGARWLLRGRIVAWAITAGALTAALALTKINVGGFMGLAAAAWMLLHARHDALRRAAPVMLGAAAALLPLALMRPLLGVDWVQTYAAVFAAASIAAIMAVAPARTPQVGWRALGWSAAAGLAVAAVVLGVVFLRGTTPRDLIDGVLLAPLRHPTSFSLRYEWPRGTVAFAVGSLALCVVLRLLRPRRAAAVETVVEWLRLLAALGIGAAVLRFPAASPDRLVFAFALPCVWVFLWPLSRESRETVRARAWVGLLLLGQFLHAFPVAGSQIAWGTFLVLPLAATAALDAAGSLGRRFGGRAPAYMRTGIAVTAAAFTLVVSWGFAEVASRYRTGSDVGLPGAEWMRLPSESSAMFRVLTLNAAVHADVLFSEPGMFSLNLWSGVPAPTRANVTHWFSLLDRDRQRKIIDALEAHPRACVVVQRTHIDFLRERGFAPTGELHDYITRHFTPAFSITGFDFCVRRERAIQPVMLGEMLVKAAGKDGGENTALRLHAILPPNRPIAKIEISTPARPPSETLVLDATNARVEAAASGGSSPGKDDETLAWPFQLARPSTLTIHFDRFTQPRPMAGALITLRGPDGAEVALARLREQ